MASSLDSFGLSLFFSVRSISRERGAVHSRSPLKAHLRPDLAGPRGLPDLLLSTHSLDPPLPRSLASAATHTHASHTRGAPAPDPLKLATGPGPPRLPPRLPGAIDSSARSPGEEPLDPSLSAPTPASAAPSTLLHRDASPLLPRPRLVPRHRQSCSVRPALEPSFPGRCRALSPPPYLPMRLHQRPPPPSVPASKPRGIRRDMDEGKISDR